MGPKTNSQNKQLLIFIIILMVAVVAGLLIWRGITRKTSNTETVTYTTAYDARSAFRKYVNRLVNNNEKELIDETKALSSPYLGSPVYEWYFYDQEDSAYFDEVKKDYQNFLSIAQNTQAENIDSEALKSALEGYGEMIEMIGLGNAFHAVNNKISDAYLSGDDSLIQQEINRLQTIQDKNYASKLLTAMLEFYQNGQKIYEALTENGCIVNGEQITSCVNLLARSNKDFAEAIENEEDYAKAVISYHDSLVNAFYSNTKTIKSILWSDML